MDRFSLFFLILLTCSVRRFAATAFSLGSTFSREQTIASADGIFELGLFAIPNHSSNMYVGISYKNMQPFTQVWVANREEPVSQAARYGLSATGSLQLMDANQSVWSRGGHNVSSCELLPTGNLVLLTYDGSIAWQSFDEPSDTFLAVGPNRNIRSWKTPADPSPGFYEFKRDSSNTGYLSVYNSTTTYWATGPWTGRSFLNVPGLERTQYLHFSFSPELGLTWALKSGATAPFSRIVISPSGSIQFLGDDPYEHVWHTIRFLPDDVCEITGVCGIDSICNAASDPPCSCLSSPAFEPVNKDDWGANPQYSLQGCQRVIPLNCSNGVSDDGFLPLNHTSFDMAAAMPISNVESQAQCESLCLANCYCTAFYSENEGKCFLFTDVLANGEVSVSTFGTFYVRVASRGTIKPDTSSNKRLSVPVMVAVILVGGFIMIALSLCVLSATRIRLSRRSSAQSTRTSTWLQRALGQSKMRSEGGVIAFSYGELQAATRNFRDKLGSGGFGTVYRGVLPGDGLAVAVKKLERLDEGEKQFRAEIKTLGTIQHVNLVRLLGFCCSGKHRLLVYELVENGSLAGALFQEDARYSIALDWHHRYEVAVGVARAIAYLHEACRERVIHCDIKPENILLDSHLNAKVTDFGLAKLIGHEFSRVLTTIRGTRGYLAPEWIAGLPITSKADVYSFGMTLLELISCRRNIQPCDGADTVFFPVFAAQVIHWPDANLLSLVDPSTQGKVDMGELRRMVFCAIWCIQDNESWRPPMSKVVKVLEGSVSVGLPPIPASLQCLAEAGNIEICP